MLSNSSNWLKDAIFGKSQNNQTTVYRNILNLLPNPACLIDMSNNVIVCSNADFNKMSAYAVNELSEIKADILFDLEKVNLAAPAELFSIDLVRRNKLVINGYSWKYLLDDKGYLVVLVFVSEQQYIEQQHSWQDRLFGIMLDLLRLIDLESLEVAFQTAITRIGTFFDTPHVYIYQSRSEYPELVLAIRGGNETIFPPTLPIHEISTENSTMIWTPGHRVQSEIQKTARVGNLAYVGTTLLGPSKGASAILVIAHEKKQPTKNLSAVLDVFGSTLSAVMQYFILVGTLRHRIIEQEFKIAVQNDILNHVQEGILVVQRDLKIWTINPSAEILLGYQAKEVVGLLLENILIGPESLSPLLESSRNEFISHRLGIVHIHRRNGDAMPVEMRISPVEQDGQISALLIFLRDVSENEEIRMRAQQLEHRAVLGEFTAVFAHEVRNPINNISMGLQILSRALTADPKQKDMVDRMLGDCDRLTHQMEAVLAYSKPFDPKYENVDIGLLVQKVVDRWKPRMIRVGVKDYVQKPEQLPIVLADPRLLEQVFVNLIGNAVEAMTSQNTGTLAVHIQIIKQIASHPQIEVKIIDSGPGIPEDVRGRIFEPFVTTKKTGTGLGLAISKRIVTAHRGNITVESYPGGGTVFTVFLPIKQGEETDGNYSSDR
ncbi:MAG: hypothetical protein CVU39_02530 [Chloroflexi bacterium HGW-Chloroflexi-10]|nr:MAG: hypothetical protein CVU39_02530 [Chloroflexi bacterium HGW-Chloroflexi-10]